MKEELQLPLTLHFTAEEMLTKWDIACIFADILGRGTGHLRKVDQIGQGGKVGRPRNVKLDTGELRKLGINVETVVFGRWWEERLRSLRI